MWEAHGKRLALCIATVSAATDAPAQTFQDDDWNTALFANCALPKHVSSETGAQSQSVLWAQSGDDRKLMFQVLPGDVGGCSSDSTPRDGAPFWERAELRQTGTLAQDRKHEIQFEASFIRGFIGKRETFFQIHGWSKACPSQPLMMMQFDWRQLTIRTLAANPDTRTGVSYRLQHALEDRPGIEDLNQSSNRFRVLLDPTGPVTRVSVWMNGRVLLRKHPVDHSPCAELHTKFGIYRPGQQNPGASELLLDDVLVVSHRPRGPES